VVDYVVVLVWEIEQVFNYECVRVSFLAGVVCCILCVDCYGVECQGVSVGCAGVAMWVCGGAGAMCEVVCVWVCRKWSVCGIVGVGFCSVWVTLWGCEFVGAWLSCVYVSE
jgi:hypothetical protein